MPVVKDGKVVGVLSMRDLMSAYDRELQKIFEDLLNKSISTDKEKNVIERNREAVFLTDISGNIIKMNLKAEERFGLSQEQVIGRKLNAIIETGTMSIDDILKKAASDEVILDRDTFVTTKSSGKSAVKLTVTALMSDKNEHVGYVAIVHNSSL